ncbi:MULTISPECIES: hypothetical protein [Actinoplanes]|uniref:hypothetical protein n=1 Tax=Actinoplanes TaxID=1865 RepID=UPI0005F2B538|nr:MULTISPECIES: hypothetical protein [Actinoplanes]GLY04085.1 hypothetical protein Acsp01_44640 [Actinoplanes sp. NBRC 101535]
MGQSIRYERKLKEAVRTSWLAVLGVVVGGFLISWALMQGRVPWAAGIALAIAVIVVYPLGILLFLVLPISETSLRAQIADAGSAEAGPLYVKLAARRAADGDHDEQIWLLRRAVDCGDRDGYRMLLATLTEHGEPSDVTDLRCRVVSRGGGLRPDDPLGTPWPGIDGEALLAVADRERHVLTEPSAALRSLDVLLTAAGRPDPEVWRALVGARAKGFHLRLARHLAGSGRFAEAVALIRDGDPGTRPAFPEAEEFLLEHGLVAELEEDARLRWTKGKDAHALAALRRLLAGQDRHGELARLPSEVVVASPANAQPQGRWTGVSASAMPSATPPGGYSSYPGGGC